MIAPERFETARLVLRLPVRSDAEAILHTYAQDPEVTRYLPWTPLSSLREAEQGTIDRIDRHLSGVEFSWIITSAASGDLMGMITAVHRNLFLECGFALGRAFWGKGFASEALGAVSRWAVGQPEVFRVWASCDTEHRSCTRALEKAGFARHGVLRRWRVHPAISTVPRDCLYYVRQGKPWHPSTASGEHP
jgi:RimJ/RimL family protein N-acetyltransferase